MKSLKFPENFIWGTATASYQIEGHPLADGAAPSIWHTFTHKKGKIKNNDNGDIACDHYHRYPEDIEEMKKLGIDAYRFSMSWSRIIPEPGKINQKGLDFYQELTDKLLKAGITPFCTLFHWDTPQWLQDQGGFASRESVNHFLYYGEQVFRTLGDRIKNWITINEPMVYTLMGYGTGEMAPGKRFDLKGLFHSIHHLLFSHAELCRLCKAEVESSSIGIAEAQVWIRPAQPGKEKDILASEIMDNLINKTFIDPILFGKYPAIILEKAARFLPKTFISELEKMTAPFDFVGINYYMKQDYRFNLLSPVFHAKETPDPHAQRSAMWEIYPDGLYNLLMRLKEGYGNPVCYITENGYPRIDEKEPFEDMDRIEYLNSHIRMAHKALENGSRLKGYFHWSLMDNFEWHHGYSMRFGLIHVDFTSLERKWKKSAYWYRDLVTSGELPK